MTTRPPAEVGMPLEEVDTPALLVELDPFERNLRRMAEVAAKAGLKLRPHAKAHKCPVVAHRQIALGAVGMCCQKVSEAEAMVAGGVADVFVSNEVVGAKKLRRLASLAREARVAVCVDSVDNVAALSEAARALGVELRVLVEVNVGQNRCGVEPGEAALPLAHAVDKAPGLRFGGLQAYFGTAQHIRGFDARARAIEGAAEKVRRTLDVLRARGLACETVTGSGTGTYPFEIKSGIYTELQPGSYIFMDADYGRNKAEDGGPFRDFEQSLFVYTTVMSKPAPDRLVADAGTKAVSVDSGPPMVRELADAEFATAGDEHGKITLRGGGRNLGIGDKLHLVPSHCDTTVGLYDWFVGVRGGRVQSVWQITGRGAVS